MRLRLAAVAAVSVAVTVATLPISVPVIRSAWLDRELPIARRVAEEVRELWRVSGPGAGGYASIRSLSRAFDIYSTAWNLQLLAEYSLPLPDNVDRDAVVSELVALVTDPQRHTSLPSLEVLHLATRAANLLGASAMVAEDVSRELETLSDGNGFAFEPGGPPSDAAFSTALITMHLANLPVGDHLEDELSSRIAAYDEAVTLDELLESVVPLWAAADAVLSPSRRMEHRPGLEVHLQSVRQAVESIQSLDAPTLSLSADAIDIAVANGFSPLSLSPTSWAKLVRSDGYLNAYPDGAVADAQVTLAAAVAGRPLPGELARTIAMNADSIGWADVSVGTLSDQAIAAFILRTMNLEFHQEELVAYGAESLAVLQANIRDPASLRASVQELAFYNALVAQVGGEPWMPSIEGWDLRIPTWRHAEQHWLARAYLLSGQAAPSHVSRGLTQENSRPPVSTSDALGIYLVGTLVGDTPLVAAATEYLESVRSGLLYMSAPGAASPDLLSTAAGYAMLGRTSITAANTFSVATGFSLVLGAQSPGEESPVLAAYLALGLASGFDEAAMVP